MKWKNDAPYVLCLTHDVDRTKKQWYHYCFYGLKQPGTHVKSFFKKLYGKEPYWNFNTITDLEKKYGVRSTFFFLNERHKELSANFMGRYNICSKKITDIIKKLNDDGFEIGLHGSYYSYNNLELLKEEKDVLEQIVGCPVFSMRQHHLKFDKEKTWANQKKIGIKYDSTIGYNNKVGKEPFMRTVEGIIEIPITLMDTVMLKENVFKECMCVAENGGIIMLNFHQCRLNDIEYPFNIEFYEKFIKKAKDDGAWIATVREVGKWLDERI